MNLFSQHNTSILTILRPFGNTIILRDFIRFLMARGVYQKYITFLNFMGSEEIRSILEPIPFKVLVDENYNNYFNQIMGIGVNVFLRSWHNYLKEDKKALTLIGDTFVDYANKIVEKYPTSCQLDLTRRDKLMMRLYYNQAISPTELWDNTPVLLRNLIDFTTINITIPNGFDYYMTLLTLLKSFAL